MGSALWRVLGRIIVSVSPENATEFEKKMEGHAVYKLGKTTSSGKVMISAHGKTILKCDVDSLKAAGKELWTGVHDMDKPKVAVLSGFGINCETETITRLKWLGRWQKTHVNHLVNGDLQLSDFDILAVPGGFSFGDHLGSGRLLGNRLRFSLREEVRAFVASKSR